jgi:hypothetical protein
VWHQPGLLVSGIGAVAGLTYFFYRQHLDETKLFKELFFEFTGRYEKLNDRLNMVLFGPREGDLSETERELLFAYFNLCAEEYLFYEAGYIDRQVWQSWKSGMDVFFAQPRILTLWESDRKTNSYYGFHLD